MIRYPIGRADLIQRISSANKTWIKRAFARTEAYRKKKRYTGGTDFWGEIKKVYIDLQCEKCAYCETKLQGSMLASKVHEVEHFRPKSRVRRWPDPGLSYLSGFVAPCPTGMASDKGYYLLAYHPFNYAIACTRCNSTLKSDYFPVRGKRQLTQSDPSLLQEERALLIYPLSDLDADPRTIIVFDGVLAVPRAKSGFDYERAMVTIAFFQLNHQDLTTRRAGLIGSLFAHLESRRVAGADSELGKLADEQIQAHIRLGAAFSACMAAFVELYQTNRKRATEIATDAQKLLYPTPPLP